MASSRMVTSKSPRSASSRRRAGSPGVSARPTPKITAKTISASMSPSLMALTTFEGTRLDQEVDAGAPDGRAGGRRRGGAQPLADLGRQPAAGLRPG